VAQAIICRLLTIEAQLDPRIIYVTYVGPK
jgi:hypothetical protein